MAGKNERKVEIVRSYREVFADHAGERLEETKGKPGRICQGKMDGRQMSGSLEV